MISNRFQGGQLTSKKGGHEADLDIEEKILRRREMAHLFQWYYPESGWGWIILLCAFLSQALAHGLQFGFSYPLGVAIRKRFFLLQPSHSDEIIATTNGSSNQVVDNELLSHQNDLEDIRQPLDAQHIGKFVSKVNI